MANGISGEDERQKLLAQIRGGVRLRHVQTVDKSGLVLDEEERQQLLRVAAGTPNGSLDSQGCDFSKWFLLLNFAAAKAQAHHWLPALQHLPRRYRLPLPRAPFGHPMARNNSPHPDNVRPLQQHQPNKGPPRCAIGPKSSFVPKQAVARMGQSMANSNLMSKRCQLFEDFNNCCFLFLAN